jgi:hypothetical protein
MGIFHRFSGEPPPPPPPPKQFSGRRKFSSCVVKSASVFDSRNPDPENFRIVRYTEKNNHTLVEVHYPNCTNFNGTKILLIAASYEQIKKLKELDPHFIEEGSKVNIIARFRPTTQGWGLGQMMLDNI